MIEHIAIKNFKSIVDADISLKRLTVLIGANGVGKSNLIKALEFLSIIPRAGIAAAINQLRGADGILPKSLPESNRESEYTELSYKILLPPSISPPISVEHKIKFQPSSIWRKAESETLCFNQVLAVAEIMSKGKQNIDARFLERRSSFRLERLEDGKVIWSTFPKMSKKNIPGFLQWLGVPFLEGIVNSSKELDNALSSLSPKLETWNSFPGWDSKSKLESFIDPQVRTMVRYASQARTFSSYIARIRRYDLLLNELRTDQQMSRAARLNSTGSNLPSVLKNLRPDALNRIKATLGELAPHVEEMTTSSLRTGKEFIEFIESKWGRPVESWESSDGTLRALAILIAIETQPSHSTILIEEPEQNIHPWGVRAIIEHIRGSIKDRDLQVIITTHSQQVLERVAPDEVLVVTRSSEKGTKFSTIKEILPNSHIVMGEIGKLWVSGLLQGVPTYE